MPQITHTHAGLTLTRTERKKLHVLGFNLPAINDCRIFRTSDLRFCILNINYDQLKTAKHVYNVGAKLVAVIFFLIV